MKYYRADKRDFQVGDRIGPAGEYYDKFKDVAREVEDALEKFRPKHKVPRTSCIFVFQDESAARNYWSKMTNGKLYRVNLNFNEIYHQGDMLILDQMLEFKNRVGEPSLLANKYWLGEFTENPVVEILTSTVIVEEIISKSEDERKKHFIEKYLR